MESKGKQRSKRGRKSPLSEWEKPAIVSRERLEVIAAVCSPGKGPIDPLPDCLVNTNS